MSYVVLARKWRPKHFQQVVGQGHVARTLKNSIRQDRVAHSYLFTGARGVGKTSTARILAKALNCERGPTETPCYECSSCLEISQGQSVDVFEIDGASNRGINEIRELREGARYAPSRSRYKIYIIDEVHMLTTEAFNALLKTLEEPPPHVKFIFATTEPQKIPVTILSRCQRFDFKRIGQHDIVEHLLEVCAEEGIEAEQGALQLIARQAAGGMRDALSLLDQVISFAGHQISEDQVTQILGVANRKQLFELSAAILDRDAQRALLTLDDVHRYGYDLQQFASEMVNQMRDLMVVKVVAEPQRVTTMTAGEIAQIKAQLEQSSAELLHRYFSIMVDGAQEMSRSPYPKLIFEMTLVRMAQLEPLVGLDLLIDKLHDLESTLEDVPDEALEVRAKKKTELTTPLSSLPPAPSPPDPAPAQASAPPQTTSLDQAIASAPAPQTSTKPAQAEPEGSHVASPKELDVAQLDEDLERLAEEAEREEELLGLESEEHDDPPEQAERYEIFSLHDSARARPDHTPTALSPQELVDEEALEEDEAHRPQLDLEREGRLASWRKIVAFIRSRHAPLAATLDHAYIEELTVKKVSMTFVQRYGHFVNDDKRLEVLRGHFHELFSPGFEVQIGTRFEDRALPGCETLAQLRDIELRARREQLADDTEQHPIVRQAHALFSPTASRVMVALHED